MQHRIIKNTISINAAKERVWDVLTKDKYTRQWYAEFHPGTYADSPESPKVIWGMSGRMNYPLNLMTAMMSGALKKDIDVSLGNLKELLEKNSYKY